jgi:hypothetical protein
MTERLEAARSMRENATRLRQIAKTETQLSAELRRIADEIDRDAERVEHSFMDNPPRPANEDEAVA